MTQPLGAGAAASAPRPRRAALVYNATAGRPWPEGLPEAIASELAVAGWDLESRPTAAPGDATGIAAAAASDGLEALFVLGGDGTQREAAAGLLGAGTRPALGVLPGGTTNVLAGALGLPLDPLAAARAHARSVPRPFDVGQCGRTPFLMMVSAGLDAHTLAHLAPALKARFGKAGIVMQALRESLRYRFPSISLVADGESLPSAGFAAICNIAQYGGPFSLAPQARWNDGRLDLVAHHRGGRQAALGFGLDLVRGRHLRRRDVVYRSVREVRIDGPRELFLQVDGDVCDERLPVTVRPAGEISMLVPEPEEDPR